MILKYREKILRLCIRYYKRLLLEYLEPFDKTIAVFILGYGRSGTSLMANIFEHDKHIETIPENDPRIADDYMLVYEKISTAIKNCKMQVLVMKPILNSFEGVRLLEIGNESKIIWMFREYRDVVASAIAKFGNTVSQYLKNFVLYNRGHNWISLTMPRETLKILREVCSTSFNDFDWMALVWWSVNNTVILDRLYENNEFTLIRYEELCTRPNEILKIAYNHIGLPSNPKVVKYIHASSIGKGKGIKLNPLVEDMCEKLKKDIKPFLV